MTHEADAPTAGVCWCGSTERPECFRTPRFGLIRCSKCGTYQIDPPPIGDELEAEGFYTNYYADVEANSPPPSKAGRTSRFWRVVERAPSAGRVGRAVLDFGSGEGSLCGELSGAGWPSVSGIDVSQSRVARARKRHPEIHFEDRGSAALSGHRQEFDLVIMDNVVEHLSNPTDVLAQLRTCLVGAGRLVLITPNMESGRFRLLGRRWTPELSPHAHIFLFTPASLTRLVEGAGFRVTDVGNFLLPLEFGAAFREFRRTGAARDLLWRLGQEAGGLWGRLIRSGEMVFVVAERKD